MVNRNESAHNCFRQNFAVELRNCYVLVHWLWGTTADTVPYNLIQFKRNFGAFFTMKRKHIQDKGKVHANFSLELSFIYCIKSQSLAV